MSLQDVLHAKQNRIEKERLEKIIQEVGALDYLEIVKKTEQAQASLNQLNSKKSKVESETVLLTQHKEELTHQLQELQEKYKAFETLEELQEELKKKRKELLVVDEASLMESFALYRPTYALMTVEELKLKLEKNRQLQKDLIKNGAAAFGAQNWTVNNSAAQGKKLVDDMKKLCLRSFNNECEAAIAEVKFNNYDRCKARIDKSAEAVEKLGKIMSVSISPRYIQLKNDELKIALEYQIQKQREKDEQKEFRAQQREEARVARELEEARKDSLKEQQHYQNALEKVQKQIANCTNDTEMDILKEKQSELVSKLGLIEEEIAQIDYRQANQKAGYVYIISNIGAFGENVYKIGMTRRLEPQERVDELGDASVPFNFDVHAMIFSDNAPALEAALHRTFNDRRLNYINNRREFFHVSLDEIKQVVKENHDKSVEFIDVPPADQYRETVKMRETNTRA